MIISKFEKAGEPCGVCSGSGCVLCAKMMGEHDEPCETCPACSPVDGADFASLLEREPREEHMSALEIGQRIHEEIAASVAAGQSAKRDELVSSMAARISSLEGVLREIRGKAARGRSDLATDRLAAVYGCLDEILSLIGETLDPHKPWCRDENHRGPCLSDPEEREDGE